jgi:hypothetical protein
VISPLHVARLGGNSPGGVSPCKPCRRNLASRCASLFDARDLLSIHYLFALPLQARDSATPATIEGPGTVWGRGSRAFSFIVDCLKLKRYSTFSS